MRLKKGFTLAEILIVLMVIGVIATMTIPALMKGVTEAQFKTGYKKAFNTIVNLAAMERISGSLPTTVNENTARTFYVAMNNNLSVKEYASIADCPISGGLTSDCKKSTSEISVDTPSATGTDWIITEDGMAYTLLLGTGTGECLTKQGINALTTDPGASSCMVVLVDVNGLGKGPNKIENQSGNNQQSTDGTIASNYLGEDFNQDSKMDTLIGDQYFIYVGKDGATAGPRLTTISGRIVGDLK